ncbi:NAD(P)/FAD-dependent oxidoreductase [Marinobacter halodurans]|uniref:NAD(P)/FAD-dependent oxidoreductase n=1 Tax=Marinobacter halodurans TaxID=2528979 RepID=A0ABY1ZNW6_9GAMM|nr:NAD(P)/FAD-dependent oxidoreductase [Marinobacter halodurans]TBW56852.1 NAD(P)/FAD-dependent oxidoreductase [Marinobacter halodurans]
MSVEQFSVDAVVIGAGVVGLACARELALAGQGVVVLEAGDHWGEGTSSRNSEVIHAGLYYPPDSLKARFCIEGKQNLYRYCEERRIPCRRTGKWIIATEPEQAGALTDIEARARSCDVPLQRGTSRALEEALPDVSAHAGLFSPTTGIVDSHALMLSLLGDLEAAGGYVICRAPAVVVTSDGEHRVQVGGDSPCELMAPRVINAAGLDAIALLDRWAGYPVAARPQAWFARGCYFSYSGRHPFGTLVYPVPEPGGLGIHLTLDMAGQARFGPDVEWVDDIDYRVDPGRRERFAASIRTWWPALDPDRLQPAYAGIRPKLGGPGTGFHDFLIQDERNHGLPGAVMLLGIESPGLTACLALAKDVAARLT